MRKLSLLLILLTNSIVQAECVDDIAKTSGPFESDFEVGQFLDQSTGLVWYQCQLGQTFKNGVCVGDAFSGTWYEALQLAENFSIEGFNNWRLPNIKELQSLVEYSCLQPMLQPDVFATDILFPLWSSTPELVESELFNHYAHGLTYLGRTFRDQKDETFSALLVRDKMSAQ